MRCPHCQHEHREGARFCAACGSAFASPCPACGSQPPPGAAFCDHCGTPLTGTTTAVTPPPLAPRPQTLQAYTPTHLAEKILHSRAALEGERDPSASYAYLREVRQRMEAITWEEAEATMALYGSPEMCVQKLRDAHARCGMDQVICWFNRGRAGASPAGPGQYATFRRGGDARGWL
jgi:hypothetical protein